MFRIPLEATTVAFLAVVATIGVAAATPAAAASRDPAGGERATVPADVVGGPIRQQCTIVTTQDPNGFIRRRRVCR